VIVKLTRAQLKQLKPYFDHLKEQPVGKPFGFLVAQISDVLPQMRVGFIPGKLAKTFTHSARELPTVPSDAGEQG
jgi:hypothetical protein